jgi:chemotaxis protein methyltransferase CheR
MPDRNQAIELKLLIEAIYLRYSYDFRDYSSASLKRRVLLALKQMHCESISELQRRILYDPQAFMELLQFLTIPVSEMFRDPSYYLALREQVIPVLCTYPSLKIWIAGCSTGEEVYSMAILLKEAGLLDRTILYATDINPRSLERARQGIFNIDNMRQYTSNYQGAGGKHSLSDYYTAAYDSAIMDKSLKENITFADHSLATDSVFAETQLISCRNVLIYFNKPLQNRAFGLFYDSLCHRGFLGLGSKETVEFSGYAEQFEAFDKPERVFRKL